MLRAPPDAPQLSGRYVQCAHRPDASPQTSSADGPGKAVRLAHAPS